MTSLATASAWKAWLPEAAFRRIDTLIGQTIERWSGEWFARRRATVSGGPAPDFPAGSASGWRVLKEGLALSVSEEALVSIAGLMLDAPVDTGDLKAPDKRLLERLSSGCTDDLCRRLAEAFGLPAASVWHPVPADLPPFGTGRSYTLGEGGEPLARLLVDADFAVALAKASIPFARKRARLQPADIALARQPVSLSALLGRCELSLFDLSGLTEGDVLVLDRDAGAPLDLAIDGRVQGVRCRAEQQPDLMCLQIIKPVEERDTK